MGLGFFRRSLRALQPIALAIKIMPAQVPHSGFISANRFIIFKDAGTGIAYRLGDSGKAVYGIQSLKAATTSRQFKNFSQISCGSPFTEEMERGIVRLGEIV